VEKNDEDQMNYRKLNLCDVVRGNIWLMGRDIV